MDRNRSPLGIGWRHGIILLPLLFLALFFFYPLVSIFSVSLFADGQLDISGFLALASTAYYRDVLVFTTWQALLSTILTMAAAIPGAYVFARFRFPGRSLLLSLSTLPFILPTVVVATAFNALLGPRGLLNQGLVSLFHIQHPPIQLDRTLAIILIVHVFYNYSIALRIIAGYWSHQSRHMEEAACILGATGWRIWHTVWLPVLRPALTAAFALVFIFTFTSFGVVLVLGGPRFATLEVEIYRQAVNIFNLPMAAALSLVQMLSMFALMMVYTRLQRMMTGDPFETDAGRQPATRSERLLLAFSILFILFFLLTPLLALVIRSITGDAGTLTLQFFRQLGSNPRGSVLFVPPALAVANSIVFALITTMLAVVLGLIMAYLLAEHRSRMATWFDPLFMLPLAASAVTLGFGYIIALDKPPLNLRTSPWLIPIAHTLVAMPLVVRSVLPSLRAVPSSLRESATILGASPAHVWWTVDMPLISRGLAVGATFAFTVSMGEFGASLFIVRPDTPTLPIVIFRLLGQPGASNYGQAHALSVILLGVCLLGFTAIERMRSAGVGEF